MLKITSLIKTKPKTPDSDISVEIPKLKPESIKNSENYKFKFIGANQIPKRQRVGFTEHLIERDFINYNKRQYEESKREIPTVKNQFASEVEKQSFVISDSWITTWKNFTNGTGPRPTQISNKDLHEQITVERRKQKNFEIDSDLEELKSEYHIISWKKFKFFYDIYGCDQIIQIKLKTKKFE